MSACAYAVVEGSSGFLGAIYIYSFIVCSEKTQEYRYSQDRRVGNGRHVEAIDGCRFVSRYTNKKLLWVQRGRGVEEGSRIRV